MGSLSQGSYEFLIFTDVGRLLSWKVVTTHTSTHAVGAFFSPTFPPATVIPLKIFWALGERVIYRRSFDLHILDC